MPSFHFDRSGEVIDASPPGGHDNSPVRDPDDYEPPLDVALVCSSGGHLAQLYELAPWWRRQRRWWATFNTGDAVALLAEEDVVWAHWPVTRDLRNFARNLVLAWQVLRRRRPDLVVSTGAGVAVPFFVVAKLLGLTTVYVEVFDRTDSRPLASRLCYPLSDLFLLQSPDQQQLYPRGRVIGRLL